MIDDVKLEELITSIQNRIEEINIAFPRCQNINLSVTSVTDGHRSASIEGNFHISIVEVKRFELSEEWTLIEENTPDLGVEVLFQNDNWINEDFNPKGIRIGFRDDLSGYTSAYWSNNLDGYFTRTSAEDDEMFDLSKAEDQIPQKWRHI